MLKNTFAVILALLLIFLALALIFRDVILSASIVILLGVVIRYFAETFLQGYSNGLYDVVGGDDGTAGRMRALRVASIYLSPYKSIWKDLKLTNKNIILTLLKDGKTIKCEERNYPHRCMLLGPSTTCSHQEVWNLLCSYFSWNKTYDDIVVECKVYDVYTKLIRSDSTSEGAGESIVVKQNKPNDLKINLLVDINNCSEIELTELPGISIVLAKRVIKKREEIQGFKSIDDFFLFLKIKPHMREQLQNRIKIEKFKGYIRKKLNEERSVDL